MRILFVDDEPNILNGLKRMLRAKRHEWDMEFHEQGAAALASMAESPCDVIVSDMRMPGMDGVQLLSAVKKEHPDSIRIALSGQTDSHMIYRCIEHAHQYLAKPCEADILVETVNRAFALRDLLADSALVGLVSNLSSIPSMPEQYQLIVNELQSEDASLANIGQIIESDVAMTAKILQMVNSAFFGMAQHVSSPGQAAMLLGIDVIKGLVLSSGVISQFDSKVMSATNLDSLWVRSVRIAALAKKIALDATDDKILADYAYMSGMLSEIGKIVLASHLPERYIQMQQTAGSNGQMEWQAEIETFGHSHMQVGAYLVGLWGLPNPIVEAVAFYHKPSECSNSRFTALGAVHAASAIVHGDGEDKLANLDQGYIDALGLNEKVEHWRSFDKDEANE